MIAVRHATPAALALLVGMSLAVGCGSSDPAPSTSRAATPAECREFVAVRTPTVSMRNDTPSPLTFENKGVTCADFSGKGTPLSLNGTVQPGAEISATLSTRQVEVRWNVQAFSDDVMVPPFVVKIVRDTMTISSSVSGTGFGTRATVGETMSGQSVVAVVNELTLTLAIEK